MPRKKTKAAPDAPKSKCGAPAYEPTDAARALVLAGVMCLTPQATIARALRIDEKTLRKHFAAELEEGDAAQEVKLAGTLMKLAQLGDKAACMFLLKTKFGWRETQQVEHTGEVKTKITYEWDFAAEPVRYGKAPAAKGKAAPTAH